MADLISQALGLYLGTARIHSLGTIVSALPLASDLEGICSENILSHPNFLKKNIKSLVQVVISADIYDLCVCCIKTYAGAGY